MIWLALLAGCAEPQVEYPYDAPGPFTAGTREGSTDGAADRVLPVTVWYPSSEAGADPVRYEGVLPGNAYTGLQADCTEARPVLLFSHGSGGLRFQSTYLPEFLATHGWVVVAMEHVGNSYLDASASIADVALWRPEDVAASYDWVRDLSELSGCVVEADGYAVSGHSFGGYTTYAVAGATIQTLSGSADLSDDRVWAGVAFAPWNVAGALGAGAADITVPMMTLSGRLDATTPWSMVAGIYDHLVTEPRYLGEFPEAGHYSFSPIACSLGGLSGDGCGDGFVDIELVSDLTQTATLSFLESVRGVEGARAELPEGDPALLWTITE